MRFSFRRAVVLVGCLGLASITRAAGPRDLDAGRVEVLTGRVLNSDGKPVAGVVVRVAEAAQADGPQLGTTTTDGSGAFRFEVERGQYRLEAEHDVGSARTIGLVWAHSRSEIELRLASSSERVAVTVVDAAGVPVPRFLVRWRRGTSLSYAVRGSEGLVELPWNSAPGSLSTETAREPASLDVWSATDSAGRTLLLGNAAAEGLAVGTRSALVRLPVVAGLSGVLLDEDGKAVAGVLVDTQVRVVDGSPRVPGAELITSTRTGADGRYSLAAFAEVEHWLRAEPSSEYLIPDPWRGSPGRDDTRVLRRAVAATVAVLSEAGEPIRRCTVSVDPRRRVESDHSSRPWYPDLGHRSADSDREGRVRLERLDPSAEYELRVTPPARGDAYFEHVDPAWSPRDSSIVLRVRNSLEGVVRQAGSEVPPSGIPVVASDPTGAVLAETPTDGAGRFRFVGLEHPEVRLTAWHKSAGWYGLVSPRDPPRAGARHVVVAGPNDRRVQLEIPAFESTTVPVGSRLEWPGEADVEDVFGGTILRREGEGWALAGYARYSGAEDGLRAFGYEPGEHYAVWFDDAYLIEERFGHYGWSEFDAGSAPPALEFLPGAVLAVQFSNALPDPWGVEFSLYSVDFGDAFLRTGRQAVDPGRFEIPGLRPGTYRVELYQSDQAGRVLRASGVAATGTTLTLRLEEK